MKFIKLIIVLFFFIAAKNVHAQKIKTEITDLGIFPAQDISAGSANIIQDEQLKTILLNHAEANKTRPIHGYRVQIFFGTGNTARQTAAQIKKDFLKKFPDVPAYEIYEAPYFKVRVGNYRTRLEATKMKIELSALFTNTFIIEEKIEYPQL